jgi:hypothetical protein
MNDPERSRTYSSFPAPHDITHAEYQEYLRRTNTRYVADPDEMKIPIEEEPTESAEDTKPPTVVAFRPDKDATGVALDADIYAIFSQDVTEWQMTVKGSGGAPAKGTSQLDEPDLVGFTQEGLLAVNTRYTVEVSGAKDVAGNAMPSPFSWSFTTGMGLADGENRGGSSSHESGGGAST